MNMPFQLNALDEDSARLRQATMSYRVFEALKQAIVQLQLRPGNLLSEAEVAKQLGVSRQPRVGQAHGLVDFAAYEQRMNATNYALTHDDGVDIHYDDADIILVGVSRSGKTPTCLYMALHYGVKAANYPLTPDDLEEGDLPKRLVPHRRKLYGLTIDPTRLQQIRQQRRPDSRYASIEQCRREVVAAEKLFRQEAIPSLSTTHTSIEEIASKVMSALGIHRHMF